MFANAAMVFWYIKNNCSCLKAIKWKPKFEDCKKCLGKKERHLPSYQKANMPWEQGCVFSYSMKIELRSLTEVSHVIKKSKKDEQRKQKN